MAQQDRTLSAAEKKAVRDRARELKTSQKKEKLEQAVFAAIEEMREDEQEIARRLHEIVREAAPSLTAKTWYGQPAYATDDGQVVVFFQAASTYDQRYSTLGFNDVARLDDGFFWPTSWAVTGLTDTDAERVKDLVRRAVEES